MVFVSRSVTPPRSAPWIGATTGDPMGLVLLVAIYVRLYFSFSPFSRAQEVTGGGSVVNQVYWLSLLSFACFVIWRNWRTSLELLRRSWILFVPFAWFMLTILWSLDATVSLRRTVLLICMAGVAFGVAAARPSPRDVLKISALATGAILSFSVISVFVVPGLARPNGPFMGIYDHKNSAGAVAAVTFVFWFFLMLATPRFEAKIMAFFGSAVWMYFLVGTESKTATALGLLAPALAVSLYYVLHFDLAWRVISYVAGIVLLGVVVWLILVANLTMEDIGTYIFQDLTFTGRTSLWEYIIRSIQERPILGHGYGAFWWAAEGLANRLGADPGSGWATTATSAHNGYLNIWLEAGLVGLVLSVIAMIVVFRDSLALLKRPEPPASDRWVYALMIAQLTLMYVRDMMEAGLFRSSSGGTLLLFLFFFLAKLWLWQDRAADLPMGSTPQRRLLSG